ncbi:MAG: phage tail tube protein [Armatimonadota bacterium]
MSNIANGRYAALKVNATEVKGVTNWSLSEGIDQMDITNFTSSGDAREYMPGGVMNWSGSINGYWDLDEPYMSAGFRPGTQVDLVKFYVNATRYFTGSIILSNFESGADVNSPGRWSASFNGTGVLTYPAASG